MTTIETLSGRFAAVLMAESAPRLKLAVEKLQTSRAQLAAVTVVDFDGAALRKFDEFRQQRALRRIGRADLLIACIAIANRATLVTRNLRHLRQVPGLRLDNWAD
jgi:tRNA(fMet)-specific endonuclease VapC